MRQYLRKAPGYNLLIKPLIRRDFWRDSVEDKLRRSFYEQLISPGDLVFDVGANMGNRTKVFLELGARVVAFEPQQECVRYLTTGAGHHEKFTLVTKALGDAPGTAELQVSDEHVISTLSRPWLEATRKSGRFGGAEWNRSQKVEVITLNEAIKEFGQPKFIKIDVEGFEDRVVSTLACPINYLSVEFTYEFMQSTLNCIEHFEKVSSQNMYQMSMGESMEFSLADWCSAAKVLSELKVLPVGAWGDIYVRMAN